MSIKNNNKNDNQHISIRIGTTDCKHRLLKFLGIPHRFIYYNNKVYELTRDDDTMLIKINIYPFNRFLDDRRNVKFNNKEIMVKKEYFDNVVNNMIRNLHGKERYSFLDKNCYYLINRVKELESKK